MGDETRRMVEGMPEPFRSAGLALVDEHDRRGQDEANGHAMRLLREALPRGWGCISTALLIPAATGYSDDVYEVVVAMKADAPITGPHRAGEVLAHALGNTVAEAADKCRAALEAGWVMSGGTR